MKLHHFRHVWFFALLTLGACTALGSSVSEDRSEWDTVFADAQSGKTKSPALVDEAMASRGKR